MLKYQVDDFTRKSYCRLILLVDRRKTFLENVIAASIQDLFST